jgi:hypothetical protein
MAKIPLRKMAKPPAPPPAPRAPAMNAAALRQVAAEARRNTPPAVVDRSPPSPSWVMINLKVEPALANTIFAMAAEQGISVKLLCMRALLAAGVPVGEHDLQERLPPRRLRMV